jgi:hypothetical protein
MVVFSLFSNNFVNRKEFLLYLRELEYKVENIAFIDMIA